jgi:hypothetical protein
MGALQIMLDKGQELIGLGLPRLFGAQSLPVPRSLDSSCAS